jgi:hypothetical protein
MGNKTAKPTPIGDHLLTMCEAAEVSRLSARTVREYARRKCTVFTSHYVRYRAVPSTKVPTIRQLRGTNSLSSNTAKG